MAVPTPPHAPARAQGCNISPRESRPHHPEPATPPSLPHPTARTRDPPLGSSASNAPERAAKPGGSDRFPGRRAATAPEKTKFPGRRAAPAGEKGTFPEGSATPAKGFCKSRPGSARSPKESAKSRQRFWPPDRRLWGRPGDETACLSAGTVFIETTGNTHGRSRLEMSRHLFVGPRPFGALTLLRAVHRNVSQATTHNEKTP